MYRDSERTSTTIPGFDKGLQDFHNAVETILNIHYLLELDAGSPENVREYLKLADPAIDTLVRISRAGDLFRRGPQL